MAEVADHTGAAAHDASESTAGTHGVRGRRIARWSAVAVLGAVGVFAIIVSVGYGLMVQGRPGSGLWPTIAAVVLLGATAAAAFTDRLDDYEPWGTESVRTVIALGSLVAFAALFTFVGFTVPAILLMLLWLRMFGRLRWLQAALLAVIGAVVLFLLFDVVLGVPMPRDPLMTPLTSWM